MKNSSIEKEKKEAYEKGRHDERKKPCKCSCHKLMLLGWPKKRLENINVVKQMNREQRREIMKKKIEYAYREGRREEKKAWINGERCENCGLLKEEKLISLCDKCLERA